jgi:O-antigen ligase
MVIDVARKGQATLLGMGRQTFHPQPTSPTQPFLLGLCVILAAAAPLCLFLGLRGFAPVIGIGGLLCLPWARLTRADWNGALILAGLVLWAAVSLAWSPAPNLHAPHTAKALSRFTILHLAVQLVCCTAFVTALRRMEGRRARNALGWIAMGVIFVLPLLIEEGLSQVALYQKLLALAHQPARLDWLVALMAQGAYVVAVLAWPLGVALFQRQWRLLSVVPAAFVPLSMVVMRGVAPSIALVVGLASFILVIRAGPRAIKGLAIATAAHILTTPLVFLTVDHLHLYDRFKTQLAPSWAARLQIWGFIAERLFHDPWRGAGLDASRTFPGVVPLHPHNAPLQLWYELGLPGALLGTLFWLWLWRRIGDCVRRDRLFGATAAATATAYLTISAVSFGLWQEWWLCIGAFAMVLCILLGKALAPEDPP